MYSKIIVHFTKKIIESMEDKYVQLNNKHTYFKKNIDLQQQKVSNRINK